MCFSQISQSPVRYKYNGGQCGSVSLVIEGEGVEMARRMMLRTKGANL